MSLAAVCSLTPVLISTCKKVRIDTRDSRFHRVIARFTRHFVAARTMTRITQIEDHGAAVAWSPIGKHADFIALGAKVCFLLRIALDFGHFSNFLWSTKSWCGEPCLPLALVQSLHNESLNDDGETVVGLMGCETFCKCVSHAVSSLSLPLHSL